ncbi:MAG TPA: DNA methyltransferase [Baekduia sp.]|nr:DNA methyltransferase [Baekduia sp.]
MTISGEEVGRRLVDFARKWSLYDGSERAEAQTFLNGLFECYGTDRLDAGARFEEPQSGRFLDLIWSRRCIIEMKRPSEAHRLSAHRAQAMDYWRGAADPAKNVPAPRFVVLCAFQRFEVWEPGAYPNEPRAEFTLLELPDRLDALMFLAEREPVFVASQEAVTRDAVRLITNLYQQLGDRRAAGPDELRDFLLQSVWCLFAEDLGQLEGYLFTQLIDDLIADPRRSSADDIGQLFEWLNRPGERPAGGLYSNTRYVNGGLFERPSRVHLDADELRALRLAAEYDWRKVEPHIFGSLLQGALGRDAQHALGAHYTHEVDIQKVVKPSIVDPWRARVEDATTLDQVRQLQNELLEYVILDPACGSGNFLYIAYREMRRIEKRLHERERDLRLAQGRKLATQGALSAFFPLTNIKGIEINAFAVSLARVTLWMAHKLSVDELDLDEATLPLEDLSGIRVGDALRIPWPKASVIVGNPPFHGDRNLRALLGDGYLEWLKREFRCGIKDHCVYWFRRSQDHLGPGQRAGLVATNSVTQNRARSASLNYVVENGGVIADAISSQPWPGDAVVEVSIVNWINDPPQDMVDFVLDNDVVAGIDTALRESTVPVADVPLVPGNRGYGFQGFLPGAKFDISVSHAETLLASADMYADVVRPYLDGRDITRTVDQRPSRYTIDFGQRSLEEAAEYPLALEVVRAQAKQARESSTSYSRNPRWWQFLWPRPEFRAAADGLDRFIVGSATGKRITFIWAASHWRPSNSTNMFALDSDYAMGVLCSRIHVDWGLARSSTMRTDPRYTPTSAFDTFPWPQASEEQRIAIGELSRNLIALRAALCADHQIGLTQLYNRMDEGGFSGLAAVHNALDLAVVHAFGWQDAVVQDVRERNHLLYELNARIVAGSESYRPF